MGRGVVNQAVIGIADALGISVSFYIVNITFFPCAAAFFRKKFFVVPETVTADAFSRGNAVEGTFFFPAQFPRFFFCNVMGRKRFIFVNISGDMLFIRISAVFFDGNSAGFFFRGISRTRWGCRVRFLIRAACRKEKEGKEYGLNKRQKFFHRGFLWVSERSVLFFTGSKLFGKSGKIFDEVLFYIFRRFRQDMVFVPRQSDIALTVG